MVSYHDLVNTLKKSGIQASQPVIVHVSLSAFGNVRGGAATMLGALLAVFPRIMMPAFTFNTMLIPEDGPPNNGVVYGSGKDLNRMAEFFERSMPVDSLMGSVAEALRRHPSARRSNHPILSFCGIGVDDALASQSLQEPFAPIHHLSQEKGAVILMGVDQSVNTSIHLGEQLAGRKTFTRWALTEMGIVACPNYPGCSDGFPKLEPKLKRISRTLKLNNASITAIPLDRLLVKVQDEIRKNPTALLCSRKACPRCDAQKAFLKTKK